MAMYSWPNESGCRHCSSYNTVFYYIEDIQYLTYSFSLNTFVMEWTDIRYLMIVYLILYLYNTIHNTLVTIRLDVRSKTIYGQTVNFHNDTECMILVKITWIYDQHFLLSDLQLDFFSENRSNMASSMDPLFLYHQHIQKGNFAQTIHQF